MKNMKLGVVAVALTAGALLAASGPAAAAAGSGTKSAPDSRTSCQAWVETRSDSAIVTGYRVVATCGGLDAGFRARGVLDTVWESDRHTEWFTKAHRVYFSDWASGWAAEPTARMMYERV